MAAQASHTSQPPSLLIAPTNTNLARPSVVGQHPLIGAAANTSAQHVQHLATTAAISGQQPAEDAIAAVTGMMSQLQVSMTAQMNQIQSQLTALTELRTTVELHAQQITDHTQTIASNTAACQSLATDIDELKAQVQQLQTQRQADKADNHDNNLKQLVQNALQHNMLLKRNFLGAHRTLLTFSRNPPCQPTRNAVADLLRIPRSHLLYVHARARPQHTNDHIIDLEFDSAAHATAAYRNTVDRSILPENTILVPKRTHIDNILHSLLRTLREVAEQSGENSILQRYSLKIKQDRIILYHPYTPEDTAVYPIHKHIPNGDFTASLPINFTAISLPDVEAIVHSVVREYLTGTRAPSPMSSDPFGVHDVFENNRFAPLQHDAVSDQPMPQAANPPLPAVQPIPPLPNSPPPPLPPPDHSQLSQQVSQLIRTAPPLSGQHRPDPERRSHRSDNNTTTAPRRGTSAPRSSPAVRNRPAVPAQRPTSRGRASTRRAARSRSRSPTPQP